MTAWSGRVGGPACVRQVPHRVVEPDGGRAGVEMPAGADPDLNPGGVSGQRCPALFIAVEPCDPQIAEEQLDDRCGVWSPLLRRHPARRSGMILGCTLTLIV